MNLQKVVALSILFFVFITVDAQIFPPKNYPKDILPGLLLPPKHWLQILEN